MTKGQDGATKMKDVPMKANTIFFNNAKTLSEDDLRGAFPQGSIQEIRIMGTGNHGFIRFTESELARKVILHILILGLIVTAAKYFDNFS